MNVACSSDNLISSAASTAAQADAVVLYVGLDLSQEAEGLDRTTLLLPGNQQQLVTQVMQAARGPVVLVIFCAGSVDISFGKTDNRVQGILCRGQAGGAAIAQVLFGEHNPGYQTNMEEQNLLTWYPQNFTRISMLNMTCGPTPQQDTRPIDVLQNLIQLSVPEAMTTLHFYGGLFYQVDDILYRGTGT